MKFQEVLKHCILVAVMFGLAGSVQAQEDQQVMWDRLSSFVHPVTQVEGLLPAEDPFCGKYPLNPSPRSPLLTTPVITVDEVGTSGGCVRINLPSSPNFSTVGGGVTDWVLVEVRAAPTGTSPSRFYKETVAVQIPALLLSNGLVVDAFNFSELSTSAKTECVTASDDATCYDTHDVGVAVPSAALVDGTDVHIVIRQRNHLDVMYATAVPASGVGDSMFDFTSPRNVYANPALVVGGAPAVFSVSKYQGRAFLAPGDFNSDGAVTLDDAFDSAATTSLINAINTRTNLGYKSADSNFNGNVSLDDVEGYISSNNARTSVSHVPGSSG